MGSKASLLSSLKLGDYTLKNRLVLSAMTRARCDPKTGVPNDLLATYYGQRANAGLLLTECSAWTQRAVSFPGAGQIYTKEQAQGWKKVVEEVHKKDSLIYLQIFHGGRASHPKTNGGMETWAPSAIAIRQDKIHGIGDHVTPKEMTLDDIKQTLEDFNKSLDLVKLAGFDGIELHGANGYLVDQFLRSHSNRRKDHYGGSVQNRARFALELIDIALKKLKPYQVGIKISPTIRYQDMFDENPVETYTYLMKELDKRKIGFVEIMESSEKEQGASSHLHIPGKEQILDVCKVLRPHFSGVIIGNNGLTLETGLQKIEEGNCDAISFARYYIANPDLAERVKLGAPLNTNYDYKTFYGGDSKGYTDYPAYESK